jgi:hypothetical protein
LFLAQIRFVHAVGMLSRNGQITPPGAE